MGDWVNHLHHTTIVKPRVLMWSKLFLILIGALNIYCQVIGEDVYVAELVVESNDSVPSHTVLSALKFITDIPVTDSNGVSNIVTLVDSGLVAECLIVGIKTQCNCSLGYVWSDEVCYKYQCCRETPCNKNISQIQPLCVAKVKVSIIGSITLKESSWDSIKTTSLSSSLEILNGFESLNVTGQSPSENVVDFEAAVAVKFATSRLLDILTELETKLGAEVKVQTEGMVTIESPQTTVCYQSSPVLKCTLEEESDGASWKLSTRFRNFELSNGSVVRLNSSCSTDKYKSCLAVTLHKVTGSWAGVYVCGFTNGAVMHTAEAQLKVALLPDTITLKIKPLTADCSQGDETVDVDVTATILNSTESFSVWWSYMDVRMSNVFNTSEEMGLVYAFTAPVNCKKTPKAQSINVTFQNNAKQRKSVRVDVPVIYAGEKFCSEEDLNGEIWPKAPDGDTVINRTCPDGRVGYKSRTCKGSTWQPVFSKCVNLELSKVANNADNFLMGLDATQSMAIAIFQGLKNSSTSGDDPSETMADIDESINVLDVMARASGNVKLQEDLFPDFLYASSNILNKTWDGVNDSTVYQMSSNYLQSVEDLVKNIQVNKSNGFDSQNLQLKFCQDIDCNVTVYDVDVSLSKAGNAGILKTVAVKNLTDKLRNNFGQTVETTMVVSATLEGINVSSQEISLHFPKDRLHGRKPFCVFWNTTNRDWSDAGCTVKTSDNQRTVCRCNHLTSFSVLMAKSDISTPELNLITYVGLATSICSLLIFLSVEFLVWSAVVKTSLSHFRHTALVNIATFRLLADLCFLASTAPERLSSDSCLVLTACKHLFYLAMFSWMLCMSVMLVHQLIFVFETLRKRVFMFLSSIVGYVCPILIVGSSYVYSKYTNKPYHNSKTCWLVFEKLLDGSIHAFILPVGTIMLTNIFSMIVVIVTLTKASVPDSSMANDRETAKSILKVVSFLTPVFGITWIIGFGLLMLEESSPLFTAANYLFTILNSFQGLFILLAAFFTEQKVREELKKIVMRKMNRNETSISHSTLISSIKEK